MIVAFARALSCEVEIFWNMKGLQLFFCVPFLTWNFMLLIVNFPGILPFFTFSRSKSDFSYLEINPIRF